MSTVTYSATSSYSTTSTFSQSALSATMTAAPASASTSVAAPASLSKQIVERILGDRTTLSTDPKAILHKITIIPTIRTCSYLKLSDMFQMIVNKNTARAFIGSRGPIFLGYYNQLQSTSGERFPVTFEQVETITRLGPPGGPLLNIRHLDLCGTITDEILKTCVRYFPNLELMMIRGSSCITNLGLQLQQLDKLQSLLLPSMVTDEDVSFLSHLTELKKLDLSYSKMTDKGLTVLTNLLLEELEISGCNFTEEGLVQHLPKKSLKRLTFQSNSQTIQSSLALIGLQLEILDDGKLSRFYWVPIKPKAPPQRQSPN